jgi:hypothetical protein
MICSDEDKRASSGSSECVECHNGNNAFSSGDLLIQAVILQCADTPELVHDTLAPGLECIWSA